jgi:collagen type III alpha
MPSATLPDALANALGRVVADVQRQAGKDIELIAAECRVMVANLKLEIASFKEEVHRLHAEDRQRLGMALAAVKDGEPGARGEQGEPGRQGERGEPGEPGAAGERGPAGERGERGLPGEKGEAGAAGERGPAGERGERGLPGEKGEAGAAGERGEKGEPGERGDIGLRGERGEKGEPARDGRDGLPGRTGPRGEKGEPGERGDVGMRGERGEVGESGLGFEHLEERIEDGGRILIRTYRRGDEVKEFRHVTAMPVYRGVWKEGPYQRGDTVTRDGSQWHCETETTATPGLSPDWRLCVKHGRAGKDGKDGERGAPGPKGESGRDLTQLGPNGSKW